MLMTHVSKINANIEVWGLGAGMGVVSSSAMCFHVLRPWRCHPGEIGAAFFSILPVPRLGCYMATQHMKNDRYTHARQRQTCTHAHVRTRTPVRNVRDISEHTDFGVLQKQMKTMKTVENLNENHCRTNENLKTLDSLNI